MNRVNITIDKALHAKAVKHAKQEHFTTFSGDPEEEEWDKDEPKK